MSYGFGRWGYHQYKIAKPVYVIYAGNIRKSRIRSCVQNVPPCARMQSEENSSPLNYFLVLAHPGLYSGNQHHFCAYNYIAHS